MSPVTFYLLNVCFVSFHACLFPFTFWLLLVFTYVIILCTRKLRFLFLMTKSHVDRVQKQRLSDPLNSIWARVRTFALFLSCNSIFTLVHASSCENFRLELIISNEQRKNIVNTCSIKERKERDVLRISS